MVWSFSVVISAFLRTKTPFLTKYCNLQVYCEKQLGVYSRSTQLGLNACAQMLELDDTELAMHRATDDAKLSFYCLKKLYNEQILRSMTELAATDEFYKKITFKTRFITDLNNPCIDKSQMFFDCPKCNRKLTQNTKWTLKGKTFVSEFRCGHCREDHIGKISFKLRYDETVVKKKLVSKEELKRNKNA